VFELDFTDVIVVAVSDLDFSDLIVLIVHLTTGRLASLKWMKIGFDWFVEVGGVQLSDTVLTIVGWFHFFIDIAFFFNSVQIGRPPGLHA